MYYVPAMTTVRTSRLSSCTIHFTSVHACSVSPSTWSGPATKRRWSEFRHGCGARSGWLQRVCVHPPIITVTDSASSIQDTPQEVSKQSLTGCGSRQPPCPRDITRSLVRHAVFEPRVVTLEFPPFYQSVPPCRTSYILQEGVSPTEAQDARRSGGRWRDGWKRG